MSSLALSPLSSSDATAAEPADLPARGTSPVTAVATALRAALTPLIAELAGMPPRPIRLMRSAGLDKSLASRLVQATRAESDAEFLHRLPSPTGLRMLIDGAQGHADEALVSPLAAAIDAFQSLLDRLPGGRQGLDAQLGANEEDVRARREHMARQASFKAVSFLFGHYAETVSTALFIVPNPDGRHLDFIEVHRRIGLQRVTPGTAVPLLSLHVQDEVAPDGEEPRMRSLAGRPGTDDAADFILAEASGQPLPALQLEREGRINTFVLPGDSAAIPSPLTTAFRADRGHQLDDAASSQILRIYMLHTPCHRLVRDVFMAESLWPRARPRITFFLPGPTGVPLAPPDPTHRHYRQLNLSATIDPLPHGMPDDSKPWALAGVPDHQDTLALALQRAGLSGQRFRGWRCEMAYPVPLIEMQIVIDNIDPAASAAS